MMKTKKPNSYKEYYLSYLNDFLTVERFADYYGFSIKTAKRIIETGKRLCQ